MQMKSIIYKNKKQRTKIKITNNLKKKKKRSRGDLGAVVREAQGRLELAEAEVQLLAEGLPLRVPLRVPLKGLGFFFI